MANTISKFLSQFDVGDLLGKIGFSGVTKGGSVLGIDIGASALKVVQLKPSRGTAVLETYGEIALGPYMGLSVGQATRISYEKLVEAVNDLLREANTTTRECGISIPFSSSLSTVVELPDVAEERIDEMVPIEARKYIPVSTSEVSLDWFRIPSSQRSQETNEREKIEVLLVAIYNTVLETYQQLSEEASLNTQFYEIESFSTVRSTLDRGVAPIMLIDIGAASTKVYIVERGIVRVSHSINKGGQDISMRFSRAAGVSFAKAEERKRVVGVTSDDKEFAKTAMLTTNHIFSQAHRVLLNYQKRSNTAVDHVVLSGGGSLLSGILDRARDEFGVEVKRAEPFSKTKAPAFLDETLKGAGPTFAVAIGLALRQLREHS